MTRTTVTTAWSGRPGCPARTARSACTARPTSAPPSGRPPRPCHRTWSPSSRPTPRRTTTDVTGPISLTLYAASTAPDTDWTAKLDVVHPDGGVVNLNNGIQRASFRDSLSQPSPITPGQPYRYTIKIWPTSYLFRAGDRIRLEVSSSDFPQFDPNPNTGSWFGQDTRTQPADQTVLHDAAHPSALQLPTVPAADEPATLPAAPTH